MVKHLKRHVASAGVRVAILKGCVRNQLGDVLFEFTQVLRDVALRETRMLIISLLLSNTRIEVGLLEIKDQVLAQKLHLLELLLLVIDLGSQINDLLPQRLVVF